MWIAVIFPWNFLDLRLNKVEKLIVINIRNNRSKKYATVDLSKSLVTFLC